MKSAYGGAWRHSGFVSFITGPEVIKLFLCSTKLSIKFEMLISIKILKKLSFLLAEIRLKFCFPAHKC